MLLEALEYLCTPATRLSRRLGLAQAAIGIRSRHARCRKAWSSHLEHSRQAIGQAALQAVQLRGDGNRAALCVVMGAGSLLDIPLAELAKRFDRVILADVVWTWPARWKARQYPNVELVTLDATAMLDQLVGAGTVDAQRLGARCPLCFTGDSPDLVVSANLLSQLPLCFRKKLTRQADMDAETVNSLCADLVGAHLDWLWSFDGVRCLLCDTAWKVRRHGAPEEIRDPLYGAASRIDGPRWDWDVALAPEIDAKTDVVHEVCNMTTCGGGCLCEMAKS